MATSAKFYDEMPKHVDPPDWIKFNYGFMFAMVLVLFVMLILYFVVEHYSQNNNVNTLPATQSPLNVNGVNGPASEQQVQSF